MAAYQPSEYTKHIKIGGRGFKRFKAKPNSYVKTNNYGKIPRAMIPKQISPDMERKHAVDFFWRAETMDDYSAPSINGDSFLITQGNGFNSRISESIRIHYVSYKYHIEQSVGTTYNNVTMCWVLDREPYVASATSAPAWGNVFANEGTATGNLNPFLNPTSRDRFKILRTKRYTLCTTAAYTDAGGASHLVPAVVDDQVFVKINDTVRYSNAATQPVSGPQVWLFAWSDVTSNTPKIWCGSDTCFSDGGDTNPVMTGKRVRAT